MLKINGTVKTSECGSALCIAADNDYLTVL